MDPLLKTRAMKTKEMIEELQERSRTAEIVPGEWNLVEVPIDSVEEIIRQLERLEAMRETLKEFTDNEYNCRYTNAEIMAMSDKALAQEEKE